MNLRLNRSCQLVVNTRTRDVYELRESRLDSDNASTGVERAYTNAVMSSYKLAIGID